MPELHERLNELRKELLWSKADIARECGISPSVISDIFNGNKKQGISTTTLIALCNGLGVTADYLLGLSDMKSLHGDEACASLYTGLSEKSLSFLHEQKLSEASEDKSQFFQGIECAFSSGRSKDLFIAISKFFSGNHEEFLELRKKYYRREEEIESRTTEKKTGKQSYMVISDEDYAELLELKSTTREQLTRINRERGILEIETMYAFKRFLSTIVQDTGDILRLQIDTLYDPYTEDEDGD